jgi:hypothetical protein
MHNPNIQYYYGGSGNNRYKLYVEPKQNKYHIYGQSQSVQLNKIINIASFSKYQDAVQAIKLNIQNHSDIMSFYNHFNPKTHQNSSQIIYFSAILTKNSTIQTGSSTEQHINEFKKNIESHCSFRDNSLFLHWKHLADDAKSWFRQQMRPHCNFSQDPSFSTWHSLIAKELSEELQLEAQSFSRPQGKHIIKNCGNIAKNELAIKVSSVIKFTISLCKKLFEICIFIDKLIKVSNVIKVIKGFFLTL